MSRKSDTKTVRSKRRHRRRFVLAVTWSAVAAVALLGSAAWLGSKATEAKSHLQAATDLLPTLKSQIAANDGGAAKTTVETLVQHTESARGATDDPLWKVASILPWLGGPNMQAVSEVATSADDVARLGGALPLVNAFETLDWNALSPSADGMDLAPLQAAAPQVQGAAYAVRESAQRLNEIEIDNLLPQVSQPLVDAREKLSALQGDLDTAADTAKLAPSMLGADTPPALPTSDAE